MPEYQQLASGSTWLLARVADHLWQATLGFLVVLLLTALLRRGPARVRYLLWLMAGVQLLLPMWICGFLLEQSPWRSSPPKLFQRSDSLLSLPPRIFSKVAGEADQFAHPVTLLSNSPSGTAHVSLALMVLWFLGFTAFNLRWWRRCRHFLRVIRAGHDLKQGRAAEVLQRISPHVLTQRVIRLMASTEVHEPGVWGVRKPIIVLPRDLADHLSNDEIETVLLHELVHVKRWLLTSTSKEW